MEYNNNSNIISSDKEKLKNNNTLLIETYNKILILTKDCNIEKTCSIHDNNSNNQIENNYIESGLNSFQFKCSFMYLFGIKINKKDVLRMFKSVNVEKCINQEKFIELLSPILLRRNENDIIKNTFDIIDKKGNGFVSRGEFHDAIAEYIPNFAQSSTIDQIFDEMDSQCYGKIGLRQFKNAIKSNCVK